MDQQLEKPAVHDTFVLERSYRAGPDKVFNFLSDPAKKRRWYAESDHQAVEVFEMAFEVGGAERTRYRMAPGTPIAGAILSTDGRIEDIAPGQRIVIASTMSLGDRRISSTLVTFELLAEGGGTRLVCTHQGVFYEGADGPQMRKGGWVALLDKLGKALGE